MGLVNKVAVATLALSTAMLASCGGRDSYRGAYNPSELHHIGGAPLTQVADKTVAVYLKEQTGITGGSVWNIRDHKHYRLLIDIDGKSCVEHSGKPNKIYEGNANALYIGPLEAGLHEVCVSLAVQTWSPFDTEWEQNKNLPTGTDLEIPRDRQKQFFTTAGGPTVLEILIGKAEAKSGTEAVFGAVSGHSGPGGFGGPPFGYKLEVFTAEPRNK
jgi:hypothetical protein